MDLKLATQHVLITGGGKGIGLACAHGFLRDGCKVSLVSRSQDNLNQALQRLQGAFSQARERAGIVVIPEQPAALVAWIKTLPALATRPARRQRHVALPKMGRHQFAQQSAGKTRQARCGTRRRHRQHELVAHGRRMNGRDVQGLRVDPGLGRTGRQYRIANAARHQ